MPIRIVLGGGIGAGKTAAARCLADLGAQVIHADEVARSLLAAGTAGARAVAARWPQTVVGGVIDRTLLGRVVFDDPGELAALEEITHPETRRIIESLVAASPESDFVVEMPILRDWFEGWAVVAVDAPDDVRVARATGRRSPPMSVEDVRAVMARQPSRSEWLLAADYVIDNSGDREHLRAECGRVWRALAAT